jgi:hypothetical protein
MPNGEQAKPAFKYHDVGIAKHRMDQREAVLVLTNWNLISGRLAAVGVSGSLKSRHCSEHQDQ